MLRTAPHHRVLQWNITDLLPEIQRRVETKAIKERQYAYYYDSKYDHPSLVYIIDTQPEKEFFQGFYLECTLSLIITIGQFMHWKPKAEQYELKKTIKSLLNL
jgi:hypothetical protein